MARLFASFLILFAGFAVTAAPPKRPVSSERLVVSEIGPKEVRSLLTSAIIRPGSELKMETNVQLTESVPALELRRSLGIAVPENLQNNTQYAVGHGFFAIPLPVEKILAPSFWKFQNFQKLLKDYQFAIDEEFSNGTDGSVSVPVGFTFGIAPETLDCKVQLRVEQGGEGPIANFKMNEQWGEPLATIYQLNSDCNMFFAGFLNVSSIYRLEDGTAAVFAQSFLYVNQSAIDKLGKIRLLAGPPGKAIGNKIKEQTVTLVKALRQLKNENRK